MFLEKAFFKGNEFWKYIIGILIVFIATLLGQIPFAVAVFLKLNSQDESMFGKTESELMKVLDKNLNLFLMLLSFVFAFFALLAVVKGLHKQKITTLITSRAKIDWNRYFFAFGIWAAFQVVTTIAMYTISPNDFVWNFHWQSFLVLFFIGVVMLPIQTGIEELMFRGYLMQGLALLTRNRWIPLIVTSLFFGGLHYSNPEVAKLGPIIMIYYIGTGLFLGILTLMDEGMELSLGFHSANNLITALLVTTDWSALQTDAVLKDISNPDVGIEVLAPVVVIFPVLLMLFSNKYGWKNWRSKLTGKIDFK
ncbi:lysostaphin resistance A-like protein [Flavobacterium sp.]|uniref:CPBP family intramembrane glutamic endopeptidase n=1 Tax=Flavobacterium sp. TaxID=239 RepID=UPI003D0E343F